MTTSTKKKIESILPLTSMQNAFLFHHLQETRDLGCLQVELLIEGKLELDLFKEAWKKTIGRHPALRTSIHWENIKKPVQVIHKEVEFLFVVKDWTTLDAESIQAKFNELKNVKSIELRKAPVSNFILVQTSEKEYTLLWNCHHILLDGWSASNIIKDVFSFYDSLSKKLIPQLPTNKASK